MSFNTCIDYCNYPHTNIIGRRIISEDFPYTPVCGPILVPPAPGYHGYVFCPYTVLLFYRMSYKWNHIVYHLLRLASFHLALCPCGTT